MKSVKMELQPITSVADIPTGAAVHGTNARAWESISPFCFASAYDFP